MFELATGKLLSTHACAADSDVTLARLSPDEHQLYVAESDLSVRVFTGPQFVDQSASCVPAAETKTNGKNNFAIRNLLTSKFNHEVVILRFNDKGAVSGKTRYVHINVFTGRRGHVVTTPSGTDLEDVSRDCAVGVDDRLALYDMEEGVVKEMLPYTEFINEAQLQVSLNRTVHTGNIAGELKAGFETKE